MPRGSHRVELERARWPLVTGIAVAVVVGAVAVWVVLFREGGLVSGTDHPVPDFSFDFGKVGGSSVADPASEDELMDAAESIRETLDEMYLVGFMDPSEWKNGRFPDLLQGFAPEARRQARRDISLLSLGDDARQIEYMDPVSGRLNIRFLVDAEQQLTGAVAAARFSGEGRLKAGGPAFSGHDATYWLRPDGGDWVIVGYRAHIQTGAGMLPEPTGAAPPDAAPSPDAEAT